MNREMGSYAARKPDAPRILTPAKRPTRAQSLAWIQSTVAKTFDGLIGNNPLKKLNAEDRLHLWRLLDIFEDCDGNPSDRTTGLDRLEQVATEAVHLADNIEVLFGNEFFRNEFGELPNLRLGDFRDLPLCLSTFASRIRSLTEKVGATKHKRQRVFGEQFLIQASEFIRLRTGTWNDEHLSELLQCMRPESGEFLTDVMSGDVIRQRRKRFSKSYPEYYRATILRVRSRVKVRPLPSKKARSPLI